MVAGVAAKSLGTYRVRLREIREGEISSCNSFIPGKENRVETVKKRILIVDDEEVILFGFKQVLSEPWLIVDTAETVNEAVTLIASNSYAAAILDLRLSNSLILEGLEFVPLLKKAQKGCRIIVITAYGDEATKRTALDSGADLFLEKPADPDDIKKILISMGISQSC
jgi:two-component system, response regulator RegA